MHFRDFIANGGSGQDFLISPLHISGLLKGLSTASGLLPVGMVCVTSLLVCACTCSLAQSCLTLCDPLDCSLPGSSVHGIFQARILEWVAISSSRGSSQPSNRTHVSCISYIGRWFLQLSRLGSSLHPLPLNLTVSDGGIMSYPFGRFLP